MTWVSSALPPAGGPSLDIEADVTVEIDGGAAGPATGRLTGSGQRLRLVVDRPEVLAGSAGRGTIRTLAARMAAAGMHAELHGPRGRIAVLDPRRNSRLSALVMGSPHVAVTPAAWPLAVRAGTPATGGRALVVAGLVLVAIVSSVVARRT